MKWMKERDALIAQTMAFVQSVTGKKAEPVEPRVPLTPALLDPLPPSRLVQAGGDSASLGAFQPPQSFAWADAPAGSTEMPRPGLKNDVRTEMKERIANFRKHQERFNREREEYFSATLAKARAAIEAAPHPRAGK